jgi:hypothetical protein
LENVKDVLVNQGSQLDKSERALLQPVLSSCKETLTKITKKRDEYSLLDGTKPSGVLGLTRKIFKRATWDVKEVEQLGSQIDRHIGLLVIFMDGLSLYGLFRCNITSCTNSSAEKLH